MNKLKFCIINDFEHAPKNYTGIIEWINFSRGNNLYCYQMNGLAHREDGPAVVYIDVNENEVNDESATFYLSGKNYTLEEFWEKQKDTIHAAKIMAYLLGK